MTHSGAFRAIVCCCALITSTTPRYAEPIRVYLLAGQSNMVGSALVGDLPAALQAPQDDILYRYSIDTTATVLASAGWTTLRPVMDNRLFFGPEITFGRAIADRDGGKVAILKVARNGSGLESKWLPGGQMHERLLVEIAAGLDGLAALGYTPQVEALIWVQGTADAQLDAYAQHYAANMATFAAAIRAAVDEPTLPIIHNQQHRDGDPQKWPYVETVRAQKALFTSADTAATLVGLDDLPLKPDLTHFTSPSQVQMGYRLAAATPTDVVIPEPAAGLLLLAPLGWRSRRGPGGCSAGCGRIGRARGFRSAGGG